MFSLTLVCALLVCQRHAAELSSMRLGTFSVIWDQEEPYILITAPFAHDDRHTHNTEAGKDSDASEEKVLFRTLPSFPFLTVGFASASSAPIESGNYRINEWVLYETPYRKYWRYTRYTYYTTCCL
jgi:hypothetical protein